MQELIDISGQKFNRLTVIRFSHIGKRRRSYWECICDCGKQVLLRKDAFAYKCSKVKSCGCLHIEDSKNRPKDEKSGKFVKLKTMSKTLVEAMPELERIAKELGLKVNNYKVLEEYRRQHPEETKEKEVKNGQEI